MKSFTSLLFLFVTSSLSIVSALAQAPPPPAAPAGKSGVVQIRGEDSLKTFPAGETFYSADGRFSISLPKDVSGFRSLTPANMGVQASGSSFQWRLKEGIAVINYFDYLDGKFSISTEQNYVDFFAGTKDSLIANLKAQVISEAPTVLGAFRGYKFTLQLPNDRKAFVRVFYVNRRNYTLMAVADPSAANSEVLLNKALDSFALVSQEKVDIEQMKSIEAATPAQLPQEPAAKKERSDAQDDNLKGKVKSVTEEDEDLSGTWTIQGRHMSSVEDFNEMGNRVKRISYDSKGQPFEITAYGYIDGKRVSNSKTITYEYDPPPMAASDSGSKSKQPVDKRYGFSYEHKYTGGRLAEMQMFLNNGKPGMRYTYTYSGDQLEELVHGYDGKLNQKYITKLDGAGNAIERTDVDVLPSKMYGDRKYSIKYESFDEQGNWTKKITSKLVTEAGKEVYKPWHITYRKIIYFNQ